MISDLSFKIYKFTSKYNVVFLVFGLAFVVMMLSKITKMQQLDMSSDYLQNYRIENFQPEEEAQSEPKTKSNAKAKAKAKPNFIKSSTFTGSKSGYIFKTDKKGTGYYLDNNKN